MSIKEISINKILLEIDPPILIVSTIVGKGNVSIGKAIEEIYSGINNKVYHVPIEELLPQSAIDEDLLRYKFISNNLTFLLNVIYRVPLVYLKKYLREYIFKTTDLEAIKNIVNKYGIKTILCISHRPAFWISASKKRREINCQCWGVLTEFGRTIAWKYIFWDCMDGYISPIEKELLDYNFPRKLKYVKTILPVRKEFYRISRIQGNKNKILIVAGYWGQIKLRNIIKIIKSLLAKYPLLKLFVICGTNQRLFNRLNSIFNKNPMIEIIGQIDSLASLMKQCAAIITKPGFATIMEAYAANRTLFLVKGMPIAEDHNANYAIKELGAVWFNIKNFHMWYSSANNKS